MCACTYILATEQQHRRAHMTHKLKKPRYLGWQDGKQNPPRSKRIGP